VQSYLNIDVLAYVYRVSVAEFQAEKTLLPRFAI
jgi:hypothetical protein